MCPLYDYVCDQCGNVRECYRPMEHKPPECCGVLMRRLYGMVEIRDSRSLTGKRNELWIDRMDDIHKAQEQRGERLRFVHPKEVL